MRLAVVIIAMAAILVTKVQIEQHRLACSREMQRLDLRQVALRRTMWDQQSELGRLTAPQNVQQRSETMAMGLISPGTDAPASRTPVAQVGRD